MSGKAEHTAQPRGCERRIYASGTADDDGAIK
jgi:hypothetical protein